MPSVLFVFTSANKTLTGAQTGWYLPEAAHPYYVLHEKINIDFAAPNGPNPEVDEGSVEMFKDDESVKFLQDPEVKQKFASAKKLSDVNPAEYDAIFYVGGHGPMIDLPEDPNNIKLANAFYQSGKITSAVCHGPGALVGVKDASGKSIFDGRNATGFSDAEEEQVGKVKDVPFLLETRIKELGGKYTKAEQAWGPKVVVDGHVITGQNPASAAVADYNLCSPSNSYRKMSGLNPGAFEFVPGQAFRFRAPQQPATPSAPAQPGQPPAPIERPEPTEPPRPAPSISISIGGPKPPADPAPAPAADQDHKPAPESKPAPPAKQKDAPAAARPKDKFNFTADKSKTTVEAVVQEQQNLVDEETLKDLYGDNTIDPNVKQHLNVVFIGHVDAGKSTMGGQLLFLSGMVDKRTMEKYEREAKEAGRESWYLSWALDSTPQERSKGKTVEVGRAYFETDARRYTILDAPGHKTFVPSMISGAAQADVAILVISARKGEFETGFEKGGQTREHIMLVKTAGVTKLVVVINKMDEPTVEWSEERYKEIKDKITPFIKASGFNPKTDVTFVPVSAYTGANMKEAVSKSVCPWYSGPPLLGLLDTMPMVDRKINGPVMMPISEKYKDMGTIVVGKLESGRIHKNDALLLMPNKTNVDVAAIYNEMEEEINFAYSGDNVRLRIRGVDDEDITPGFVLTSIGRPVHATTQFEAELVILEHKNIICAGYSAVMHVHTLSEEVSLVALLHYFDKKTNRKSKKPPQFAKKGQKIIALIETTAAVCVEPFKLYPQLGRFTLRDEGKTIAIGKVVKLRESVDSAADGVAGLSVAA
ncbi:response stimulus, partial [Rhizoctonia solani]